MNLQNIKEFAARHLVWILVAIIALTAYNIATRYELASASTLQGTYSKLGGLYDSDTDGFTDANKAEALRQQANSIEEVLTIMTTAVINPLRAYARGILIVVLGIPLTAIVLYSLTKVPFLKLLTKGADGKLSNLESARLFGLVGIVYATVCFTLVMAFQ